MARRVVVLSANPKQGSFTAQLAAVYAQMASRGHEVRQFDLSTMVFDSNLSGGYEVDKALEAPLVDFQQALQWCDHLVIFTPIWWGALPAKLKGLIDRVLLPGFAFQYEAGKSFPRPLLRGRTARLVMTMDTPPWYYYLVQGAPAIYQLKVTTLKFVGFASVRSKLVGPVIHSSAEKRERWLKAVAKLGLAAS
ncbi:putative NADPH-quinone reductase [Sinobacterium caligoides]|uniref:Putative NADPH-quinone reductase n=1 Tax=Sinobacterium caligoides TaxID=933926 RepID=A0A3N2DZ56_9GAMM|nr:NAD(P)H-dependent oxidoreductase [Sinobacterium caligoides]ROS05094.1 putative NADPH-quinone reductase [Sinobacterium caligoides]